MRTFPHYLAPSAAPVNPTEAARLLHQLRMTLSQIHCTAGTVEEITAQLSELPKVEIQAAEKLTGCSLDELTAISAKTLDLYPSGPADVPEEKPKAKPKPKVSQD